MERSFIRSYRRDVPEEVIACKLIDWLADAIEEGYSLDIERDLVKGVSTIQLKKVSRETQE